MSESVNRDGVTQASEEARALWRWCMVRVMNLHTSRQPPYLTAADALSDRPAEAQIQEVLDRVSGERERHALERAARAMCWECLSGAPRPKHHTRGTPGWWHDEGRKRCGGGPVWGLIVERERRDLIAGGK